MFDLEQSLAEWRQQMLAAGIKTPVPLEELESHLREDIARQTKAGLIEAEAFKAAVQRIGPAHALRDEFQKVGVTQEGRKWRRFEIVFLVAVLLNPLLVGSLALFVKNGSFSEMTSSQRASSLAGAVAFSLLAWGMRSICGKFPVMCTNRIRDAIFVPVLLWLVAFAYMIMPSCNLTMSQRGVVSLWVFAPFGILVGWLWGMATAARKKAATAGS